MEEFLLDIDFSVDRFCCCCSPLSICHPTSFWLPSFPMRNKPSLSTVVLSILHTRWVTAPSPSGFTLSLGTQSDHSVSHCGYFRVYLSWSLLSFLDDIYLSSYWGSFHLVFLKIFFPILFSFYDAHIGTLGISHILRALFIFFSFFFFSFFFFSCTLDWIISIILSFSLLILSSACSHPLSIPLVNFSFLSLYFSSAEFDYFL